MAFTTCAPAAPGAAASQQTAGIRLVDKRVEHALDRAQLRLQATADDGIHGVARLRAKNALGQWQLRRITCQCRTHQVETRQNQPTRKNPGSVKAVYGGRRSGADHQTGPASNGTCADQRRPAVGTELLWILVAAAHATGRSTGMQE